MDEDGMLAVASIILTVIVVSCCFWKPILNLPIPHEDLDRLDTPQPYLQAVPISLQPLLSTVDDRVAIEVQPLEDSTNPLLYPFQSKEPIQLQSPS
jgi:hypothetical protein